VVAAAPAGGRDPGRRTTGAYNAGNLSVLEGLEAVRKRPGMYVGSSDSRGLMHCLWEIIDNAVDEALGGHCDHIEVDLRADGSVEVADDGRGIPVDTEPRTGLSGVEVVLTRLHAGGKFGGGSYGATGGLHGVGASVVNALSARLDITVTRGGRRHAMSFRRGVPGAFTDGAGGPDPDAPFVAASGLRMAGRAPKGATGTRIRYWVDRQIFTADAGFVLADLLERARQTSSLVAGLEIVVRDGRTPGAEPAEYRFLHTGGIVEFATDLAAEAGDADVTGVWRLAGSGTFTETVPVLDAAGHLHTADVSRRCDVEVALRWGADYETNVRSFVNVVATPKGGTHLAGFDQGLLRAFRDEIAARARTLKPGDDKVEKDDVAEGLTALVAVRLEEPQFEGQTKEILGTPAVRAIVSDVVRRELTAALTSTRQPGRAQATAVLEKVVAAMKTRVAARVHKETARRKNALESSALPTKLVDCRTDDVSRSELFVVEGDSAMGTAKAARRAEFQALLPIRGKILNVAKSTVGDMLANNECAALIQVIGAGSGRSFDLAAARYGRVIFMADADVDGAHIRCLLLTLFLRYLRPLVEDGRVFAAVPPLHRLELARPPAGQDRYIYTYSEAELHATIADLGRRRLAVKMPPQRYKGLGEMDADQLRGTTMDPASRTLRRITVTDAAAAEATLDLLMGSEVGPRRDFIVAGAALLDTAALDV
jgi:DNA gyrase subunit B